MTIEVRIPTILRTYTGGEKAVQGQGGTLAALIEDLESNHPGLKDPIPTQPPEQLARSGGVARSRGDARPN